MSDALRGRRIVVTRPRAQADALAAQIAAHGGEPMVFPLLDIAPADDQRPLQAAISRLSSYTWVVFISPNAVAFSLPAILVAAPWPTAVQAVAIGPGTVAALAGHGVVSVLAPSTRFDSEAVLDLPDLQAARVVDRRVLIVRGNGGRELLADTLRARGAEVDLVSCYRRLPPPSGEPLQALLHDRRVDAMTLSSSEGLRHLFDLLDEPARWQLARTPLFVPHPRIAEQAKQLGLTEVILTGPADAGIIDALCGHCW